MIDGYRGETGDREELFEVEGVVRVLVQVSVRQGNRCQERIGECEVG